MVSIKVIMVVKYRIVMKQGEAVGSKRQRWAVV
jgi:hypothetical protein